MQTKAGEVMLTGGYTPLHVGYQVTPDMKYENIINILSALSKY